jgi:hypothetical protein
VGIEGVEDKGVGIKGVENKGITEDFKDWMVRK